MSIQIRKYKHNVRNFSQYTIYVSLLEIVATSYKLNNNQRTSFKNLSLFTQQKINDGNQGRQNIAEKIILSESGYILVATYIVYCYGTSNFSKKFLNRNKNFSISI